MSQLTRASRTEHDAHAGYKISRQTLRNHRLNDATGANAALAKAMRLQRVDQMLACGFHMPQTPANPNQPDTRVFDFRTAHAATNLRVSTSERELVPCRGTYAVHRARALHARQHVECLE